jgi:hypothetical protein
VIAQFPDRLRRLNNDTMSKDLMANKENFLRPLIQEMIQQVLEGEMEAALISVLPFPHYAPATSHTRAMGSRSVEDDRMEQPRSGPNSAIAFSIICRRAASSDYFLCA